MGRPGDPMAPDEPIPSCYPSATRSTWFSVHTSIAGVVQVLAYADAEGGLQALALYRGTTFTDLIDLDCSTDPQPFSLGATTHVDAGETVYAQVVASGSFSIRSTMYQTSAMDRFSSAEQLTSGYASGGWTTEGASLEPGEPLACGGGRTGWLKFIPGKTATVTFMILATTNDALALYRGSSLTSLEALGCGELNTYQMSNSFTFLHELRLTADVQRGQTYYLQVADTSGLGSPFAVSVSEGGPVVNDDPTRAKDLTHESALLGTTVRAFTRPISFMCGYQFGTVWYRFTAPVTGTLEMVMDSQPTTARRNFMPVLAIHLASTREVVACGGDTQQSVALTAPVSAGESYLVAAMSNGFPGDYRIHWMVR
jgi:hypothetical protein